MNAAFTQAEHLARCFAKRKYPKVYTTEMANADLWKTKTVSGDHKNWSPHSAMKNAVEVVNRVSGYTYTHVKHKDGGYYERL